MWHSRLVSTAASARIDPYLGTLVHVVGSRQARPNLPSSGCPFCPGGLEAPDDYDVRWFRNRWPAMPGDRCEVVLYTSEHDATLQSLGVDGVRKVIDLWADRTTELGARDDVDFVLVFENRGAEVGATIAHPHGQIYAYDHVPERPARLFAAGWQPDPDPGERAVAASASWQRVRAVRVRRTRSRSPSHRHAGSPIWPASTIAAATISQRCSSIVWRVSTGCTASRCRT